MPEGEFRAKAIREVRLLSVKIEGERRPMLLETVLEAGIKALRPNATEEQRRKARLGFIDAYLDLAQRLLPPHEGKEMAEMRKRLAAMEKKLAVDPVFTAGEVIRIRTLVYYGMTPAQVAKLFNVETQVIKRALSKKVPIQLPSLEQRAGQGRGRRALDV